MGISSHSISAYGLNQYEDRVEGIVSDAQQKIVDYITSNVFWK